MTVSCDGWVCVSPGGCDDSTKLPYPYITHGEKERKPTAKGCGPRLLGLRRRAKAGSHDVGGFRSEMVGGGGRSERRSSLLRNLGRGIE